MRLSDCPLGAKANNFTGVRLALAALVIYSHCYYITHHLVEADDISSALGATAGSYAVEAFFFLSGFLVYPSLLRFRKPLSFAAARLLRLWPGLAFATLIVFAAGFLVTTTSARSYLQGDSVRFVVENLTFVKASYYLNGVNCFGSKCLLNGSLWSLPFEVRCYIILILLGFSGIAFNKTAMRIVIGLSLVIALILDIPATHAFLDNHAPHVLTYYVYRMQRLWMVFALGILSYLEKDKIILSWPILAVLTLAQLVIVHENAIFALQTREILSAYAVLCFGFLTARRKAWSASWPDYSYGSYLFGWPVMLAVYFAFSVRDVYVLSFLTFVGALVLAAISWHLVEKPALRWKPGSTQGPLKASKASVGA